MRRCVDLARDALALGEVPVGAVVVRDGRIVGEGREQERALADTTAHAEVRAILDACRALHATTLEGATLYSTVEPCVLCGYVARSVNVQQVVYGEAAGRLGACTSRYALLIDAAIPGWSSPPAVVSGVLRVECAALLEEYRSARRRP